MLFKLNKLYMYIHIYIILYSMPLIYIHTKMYNSLKSYLHIVQTNVQSTTK